MEVYADEQIRGVLQELGIDIKGRTNSNYLALCPFHQNTDTPSFSVSRRTGEFICYNPACGQKGSFRRLIMKLTGKNEFQAGRMIRVAEVDVDFFAEIQATMESKEFEEFDQDKLDALRAGLWNNPVAQEYLRGRGLTDETMEYFDVGYSDKQKMVIFPMHDFRGTPIGLVGRSIEGKSFKNSTNLPKHETFWNLHRVRGYDEVIIVESIIDAMLVHQAGYPNVVALLGGDFSNEHAQLLNRYFNSYIVATDNDIGGNTLATKIAQRLKHKIVSRVRFEAGVKDVGDYAQTPDKIKELVEGAQTRLESRLVVQ